MKKYYNPKNVSVVHDLMVGYGRSGGGSPLSQMKLMQRAREGLDMAYMHDLCEQLGISLKEMSLLLHVSLRTLQRYSEDKVLDVDLSSKLLVLTDLYAHGQDVLGSDGFRKWLRAEVRSLGYDTPLSMLDNPFGIRRVDDTLGQIEYGVFA